MVDGVTATLRGMLAELTVHATDPAPATGAARIDRIAVLEQLRSAVAAVQHAEMVAFGREQVEQQIAHIESGRLDPAVVGRGIADQINVSGARGQAHRTSPVDLHCLTFESK